MDDQIKGDDELPKGINRRVYEGPLGHSSELGAVPNLTHLDDKEKGERLEKAVHDAAHELMKTFTSLGISGHCEVGVGDQLSGRKLRIVIDCM